MPSLILSNPLGSDDAQEMGLTPREYAVGEVITVDDYVFATLVRTGYGRPYGTAEDVLLVGEGDPSEAIGIDGQWYLDKLNEVLWGPKAGGYWPSDPIRPDRGVQQVRIDENDHLWITYSTGTQVDLGNIRGPAGPTPGPATAAAAGIVRLPGDTPGGLGGTADQPTVVGWGDKANVADVIPLTQKGTAGGVATLDGGGKIPASQVPAVALSDFLGTAGSQAAMLALTGQRGDWTTRTDLGADFILIADTPTQLASWRQITTPGQVTSVDGRTGAVSLTDLYLAKTARGVADGVAGLDSTGKVPLDQLPPLGGGGTGDPEGDGGFVLASTVADPNVPLDLGIVSNWGITDAGAVYYDDAGAPAAEAGLLIPDPETGSVAVWRPGAPWTPALDTRVANLVARADSALRAALDARLDARQADRQPFVQVLRVAAMNTATAYTSVTWDALDATSTTGMWSAGNPTVLTCTRAGVYSIMGQFKVASTAGNGLYVALWINGARRRREANNDPGNAEANFADQLYLNVGDTVALQALTQTAVPIATTEESCRLSMTWLHG